MSAFTIETAHEAAQRGRTEAEIPQPDKSREGVR